MLNHIIACGAPIPDTWRDVKTVLLPKPDSPTEWRPISIASIFRRVSASALLNNISDWADTWLPDEIYGGVKGRDPDDLNQILIDAVENAPFIIGGKIDLSKCFDRVPPTLCLKILVALGMPQALADFVASFYHEIRHFVVDGKHCAREAVLRLNGILQGCPFAAFMITALMTAFIRHMRAT